jgi:hypothetical protein
MSLAPFFFTLTQSEPHTHHTQARSLQRGAPNEWILYCRRIVSAQTLAAALSETVPQKLDAIVAAVKMGWGSARSILYNNNVNNTDNKNNGINKTGNNNNSNSNNFYNSNDSDSNNSSNFFYNSCNSDSSHSDDGKRGSASEAVQQSGIGTEGQAAYYIGEMDLRRPKYRSPPAGDRTRNQPQSPVTNQAPPMATSPQASQWASHPAMETLRNYLSERGWPYGSVTSPTATGPSSPVAAETARESPRQIWTERVPGESAPPELQRAAVGVCGEAGTRCRDGAREPHDASPSVLARAGVFPADASCSRRSACT